MKTDRDRAIEKLWQNSAHGAEWRDVAAAYDAGVSSARESIAVACNDYAVAIRATPQTRQPSPVEVANHLRDLALGLKA